MSGERPVSGWVPLLVLGAVVFLAVVLLLVGELRFGRQHRREMAWQALSPAERGWWLMPPAERAKWPYPMQGDRW